MEIYFIRHIEPDFEKGICYGQLDISLPSNYTEQHQTIINQLPERYDVVYSSPLKRCQLLADQITPNVIYDKRLMELNFGNWEGLKWDDINPIELNPWMENYIYQAPPNGESLSDLVLRFKSFVNDLALKKHQTVIIIAHAGIIRVAMHVFQNIALDKIMMEKINFGEIFKVIVKQ